MFSTRSLYRTTYEFSTRSLYRTTYQVPEKRGNFASEELNKIQLSHYRGRHTPHPGLPYTMADITAWPEVGPEAGTDSGTEAMVGMGFTAVDKAPLLWIRPRGRRGLSLSFPPELGVDYVAAVGIQKMNRG